LKKATPGSSLARRGITPEWPTTPRELKPRVPPKLVIDLQPENVRQLQAYLRLLHKWEQAYNADGGAWIRMRWSSRKFARTA